MATLIMTAKHNDIDPQAWLADVLARIASTPQGRLNELLPWEWKKTPVHSAASSGHRANAFIPRSSPAFNYPHFQPLRFRRRVRYR